MNESYMEMAIKDDDLHVLQMVYTLHKQGISSEHPCFGFRRPMRVAAAHGGLNILKWLSEQKENDEWLQDEWLLDAALKSCKVEIVQWVHETYMPRWRTSVRWKALDEIAVHGTQELLQWALTTLPDAQLTTNAMDGAAANSHLKIVEYLHSERTEGCTTEAMNNAAGNGHLAVVEYLHTHRQEGCTVRAMNDAASHGHLDIVKYLHEKRGRLYDQGYGPSCGKRTFRRGTVSSCFSRRRLPMNGAIRNGHLEIVGFLHREGCYHGDVRDAIHVAMTRNHTAVVRFVCEHYGADICADSLRFATAENMMEMIRLFEELDIDGWTVEVMDRAAGVGCLEAVQYLHSHRKEGCTTHAAAGGHLDVVKFLDENRSEGCTKRAMNDAAEKGALDVLKYLHENRSEGCTSDAIINAVLEDHVEVVRFLVDHCDVAYPDTAILYAARIGNWEMLELLSQANTCEDIAHVVAEPTAWGHLDAMKRLCELTETSATNYIQLAAGNGHWYVVKYCSPCVPKWTCFTLTRSKLRPATATWTW